MRTPLTLLASALLLAAALPARAADDTASAALQARDQEIRATLPPAGQPISPEQKAKAEEQLTKIIDFDGMASTSLGKTWSTLTPDQKKRYLDAFTRRFKSQTGEQIDYFRSKPSTYGADEPKGEMVQSATTVDVNGEPTQVAYRLKKVKGKWMIEDVIIDDVSTVETYQSSFGKVVAKDGIDGLIGKLNKGASGATPKAGSK